jgi:glycosyltransferase involved in cell wall biosynthesis
MGDGVSFVVTLYNKERFLAPVLDAIAAQTGDFAREIVIVDDGSTDGSRAIAEAFAARTPNCRVIAQPNRGQTAAANAGCEAARLAFIKLVDADDLLLPNATAALLSAIHNDGCGIAFGDFAFYDPEIMSVGGGAVPEPYPVRVLAEPLGAVLQRNLFIPSACLIATALMRRLGGFDRRYRNIIDYDIAVRAAEVTRFAEVLHPVCLAPSAAENRMSGNVDLMYFETGEVLAELLERRPDLPWAWRRRALRRAAGRAFRHALRRGQREHMARLGAIRLLSLCPYLPAYPALIRATGAAYEQRRAAGAG